MSTSPSCTECGRTATRLRKDRCDACYMRLYRNGEVPPGSSCGACGERRRAVLAQADVGQGGAVRAVLCGNCALVLARTRPRLETVAELATRVARERRRGFAEAAPGADTRGRRFADRLPAPPQLDPSID